MDLQKIKTSVWQASSQYVEKNDCSVKAVALTTGAGYDAAHAELERQGRQRHGGTYKHQQLAAIKNLGCDWVEYNALRQPNGSRYTPKTIGKFCRTGNWMVWVRGHVFAVIDGHVLDWTDGRKHRIEDAYKIVGDEEMNALTNEYNELATELGLPVLAARLRKNKRGSPEERVAALRKQVEAKRQAEKPAPKQTPTAIKHTREGTAIYHVIDALLKGGTLAEIQASMAADGVTWMASSLRAAISWDLIKKGYEIEKTVNGSNETEYKIVNSTIVV